MRCITALTALGLASALLGVAAPAATAEEPVPVVSPQFGAIQEPLGRLCTALPSRTDRPSLAGSIADAGIHDGSALTPPQSRQCTERATLAKGDEALSHLANNVPVLSGSLAAGS